ncbi:MAG: DUF4411 family protein [Ignavibacteriales bacterium]
MTSPIFVLDANVFIEAANRYYAFDLAPGFWESLVYHAKNGFILSIDRVRGELERVHDHLAAWVAGEFAFAFVSTDEVSITEAYREVMTWVQHQNQFLEAAKADFASGADGWLLAFARARNCIIVTHEVPKPDIRRKVPIPNVCQQFGIGYVNTFEMLRRLGIRWVI